MVDEQRTLAGLESIEAGPMPRAIGTAVARRRVARRVRRAGVVVGCLAVVGAVTVWGLSPARPLLEPSPHVVVEPEGPSTGVRFEKGSVLAMRLAGLEDGWPVDPSPRETTGQGDVTLLGLRERELSGLGSPAS